MTSSSDMPTEPGLTQLFLDHRGKYSDKWDAYLPEYEDQFSVYRHKPINLLEIGVQNGGSLELWGKYFSNANNLIGCDIDPQCGQLTYSDQRITVVIGDATTDECQASIQAICLTFDIIIDDGSHTSTDTIRSFQRYFPLLNNGGIFVVEDLHTSYWEPYQGSLHDPFTAMALLKRLTDVINHEHWRNNKTRASLLTGIGDHYGIQFDEGALSCIHSIEFSNSLCIIRKSSSENNILGYRRVAGTEGTLWRYKENNTIHDFPLLIRDDSHLDQLQLMQDNSTLQAALVEKKQRIQQYLLTMELIIQDRTEPAAWLLASEQASKLLSMRKIDLELQNQTLTAKIAQVEGSLGALRTVSESQEATIRWQNSRHENQQVSIDVLRKAVDQRENSVQELLGLIVQARQENENLANKLQIAQTTTQSQATGGRNGLLKRLTKGPMEFIIKGYLTFKKKRLPAADQDLIRTSGFFDPAWYLATYPDIAEAGLDPLQHFLEFGGREGRDPGPNFDSSWYLQIYADVSQSGYNPLVHYLRHGRDEGRNPRQP